MSTDNPAFVSVHHEERKPMDNQPVKQSLIMTDEGRKLFVEFDSQGAMSIHSFDMRQVVYLHLAADLAVTLTTAHLAWVNDLEEWQEQQDAAQRQKAREVAHLISIDEAHMCSSHMCFLPAIHLHEGKFYCGIHCPLAEQEDPVAAAEAQAVREAANNGEPPPQPSTVPTTPIPVLEEEERPWGEPRNFDDTPPEFERDELATPRVTRGPGPSMTFSCRPQDIKG